MRGVESALHNDRKVKRRKEGEKARHDDWLTGKGKEEKKWRERSSNDTEGEEEGKNNARVGIVIFNPIKRRFFACILSSRNKKRDEVNLKIPP